MSPPKTVLTLLMAACVGNAMAQSAPAPGKVEALPPETVLIQDGAVRVDAADFEGNILRVPEERRGAFRMSYDRVVSVVDNIYVTRYVAQKAREAGMDKDPAVQARLRQLQDGFLADLYTQKLERESVTVDLEARARELYTVDRDKYMTDEEDGVQQILIGLNCRSNLQARELAYKAYEEAKAGKEDFLALADKYSDQGEKANKGGDIGTGPVKRLVAPVREALAKLKVGEISEPVESPFGYHVLKLTKRVAPKQKPFVAVKEEILAGERAGIQRKRIDDLVNAARNSTTVVTYRPNIEKLVAPGVDLDELTRKAREASKSGSAATPKKQ
ncbi:MAG: peptidylprolyl isomerase [Usitatibacter sp.]